MWMFSRLEAAAEAYAIRPYSSIENTRELINFVNEFRSVDQRKLVAAFNLSKMIFPLLA